MRIKQQEASQIGEPPAYSPPDIEANPPARAPKVVPRPKSKEHYGIIFYLLPKINGKLDTAGKGSWRGGLYVDTKDVLRLMRQGFYWTMSNVVLEEGFVGPNEIDPFLGKDEGTFCRHYFLTDLSEEPQWTAWLILSPRESEADLFALLKVKLESLSPDLITEVFANNPHGGLIYYYAFNEPEANFNCVYGNMPMDGWWPWPKRGSERAPQADTSDNGGRGIAQDSKPSTGFIRKSINSLVGRV